MSRISFDTPAGIYFGRRAGRGFCRGKLTFHRFPTLAEAIRFVVEELPQGVRSAYVKTGDERLEMDAIRRLYGSDEFPLERRARRKGRRIPPAEG